jgi:hypothetical protein
MLQHQLSKMEIDFALEPERWKSYSASALLISLSFTSIVRAEDTDFNALKESTFQANVGLIQVISENENSSESQRILL